MGFLTVVTHVHGKKKLGMVSHELWESLRVSRLWVRVTVLTTDYDVTVKWSRQHIRASSLWKNSLKTVKIWSRTRHGIPRTYYKYNLMFLLSHPRVAFYKTTFFLKTALWAFPRQLPHLSEIFKQILFIYIKLFISCQIVWSVIVSFTPQTSNLYET